MEFINEGDRPERPMFKGNWQCGSCGKAITELPFEPDPNRTSGLTCRDCFLAKKNEGGGTSSSRPTFKGDWQCGECGGAITELPFEPQESRLSTLRCRDCFRKSRE